MPFFAKSKLSAPVLGQIWNLADSVKNGFLTAPTFSVALRLIGHAQRGENPDESLIQRPGPPPVLEGIQLPQMSAHGATPLSSQNTGGFALQAVEIRPEDRARYTRIFAGAGPVGGLLDGEKAKEIFVKSKLPFDKLGAIWNLADTKARGALDLTDFIIGMHFIQGTISGAIQSIPATLPPGLYETTAKGLTGQNLASSLRAQATGGSTSAFQQSWATMPLSPHATDDGAGSGFRFPAPTKSFTPQSLSVAQRTELAPSAPIAAQWAVTPDEKAKSDQFFDGLDTERKGELAGAAVVPFFMQSKLSETTLANIWDLSDMTQSGSLTRDEFAVAMHLINATLTGAEVPQELPANLVPPSLRGQNLPEAVDPQQTDTQKDLFSLLDDDDAGQAALPVSAATAFAAPVAGAPVAALHGQAASPDDDDFFGGTGFRSVASPIPAVASRDTATCVTPAQAPGDHSAEYGNKSLQLNSTRKAIGELQTKRLTLESGVVQGASTVAELESRFSTVLSAHEAESRLVKDLEARRDKQAIELKILREQLISEESALSRLKAEKDEIEQHVMRDREEVRAAKKRMAEVQTEVNALKTAVEKLRKESRQQKGMVAIAKKQLTTIEIGQSRLHGEMVNLGTGTAAAHLEGSEATREQASADHGLFAPGSSEPVADSPESSKRNFNPFDRSNATKTPNVLQSPIVPKPSTSIEGGAAASIVAARAGMDALHMVHDRGAPKEAEAYTATDSLGARRTKPVPDSTAAASDIWCDNMPAASGASTAPLTASFDDAFGDEFAPSQSQISTGVTAHSSTDFDEPFGGFDSTPAPDHSAASAPESAHNLGATVPASTADEVATDAYVADATEVKTSMDKGKTPIRGSGAEEIDSSDEDDEDEGPEDIEGFQRSQSAAGLRGTVDASEAPANREASSLAAADMPVQAEQCYPELPSDEGELTASADVTAAVPSMTGADNRLAAPSTTKFVGSQDTDASNAFVDAAYGHTASATERNSQCARKTATPTEPDNSNQTAARDGSARFSSHVPGGFEDDFTSGAVGTGPSAATGTPTDPLIYSTEEPPAPTASTNSLAGSESEVQQSAASSIKTRRAPPPTPVRVGASASTPAASTDLAAPIALVQTSQQTSFDDFEASFADLGPAHTICRSVSAGGAPHTDATATGGFDDAFDDADFDFVPSFDADNLFNAPGGFASQVGQRLDDDAFASIDDAFGSTASAAQPALTSDHPTAATSNGTPSGPSSAFSSFEDAFAPTSEGQRIAAAPIAEAVTPVLPAHSAGGELAPPAPMTGATDSASPALPDDAAPVRQLAGMGFSRHKVIAALEKSNYRVEKALERLLSEV